MILHDSLTISLLPELDKSTPKPLRPETLYERCERIGSEIMEREWSRFGNLHDNDCREYVRACELAFDAAGIHRYDERDDENLEDEAIVDHCFNCDRPITAGDMRHVSAISYSWEHKDGSPVTARCCWSNKECHDVIKDPVWECENEWLHAHYLRLCGLTETEYREILKKEQPTVYAARMASGYYKE